MGKGLTGKLKKLKPWTKTECYAYGLDLMAAQ